MADQFDQNQKPPAPSLPPIVSPPPIQNSQRVEKPQPTSLATGPTFFERAKAGAANLAVKAKAAAQLAAKQTEMAKITQMTLPSAYHVLGKNLHTEGRLRERFVKEFEIIDGLMRQLDSIKTLAAARTAPQGVGEKTKAIAVAAKEMAEAKIIQRHINNAFRELGKIAYEQQPDACGSDDFTRPIATCKSRIAQLQADITSLGATHEGNWVTPKRLGFAVVALVVCVCMYGLIGSPTTEPASPPIPDFIADSSIALPSTPERNSSSPISDRRDKATTKPLPVAPTEGKRPKEEAVALAANNFFKKEVDANTVVPQLCSYFTNNDKVEMNKWWNLEKIISFPQPNRGGQVILLPNDGFAYCATDFHLRLCEGITAKEIFKVDDFAPPVSEINLCDSADCILWGTGVSPINGAEVFSWNYKEHKVKARIQVQQPNVAPVNTMATYSPDQKLIATASGTNGSSAPRVRIWDAKTQQGLYATEGRYTVAFSPDGSLLAFAHQENQHGCVLWDYKNDKKVLLKRPDDNTRWGYVAHVAFIPNTTLLAVMTRHNQHLIEMWDTKTHALVAVLKSPTYGGENSVWTFKVSQDGRFLVTGDRSVQVWHLPSGGQVATLSGCKEEIASLSISADGNRIAAATNDKKVIFWTRSEKSQFSKSDLDAIESESCLFVVYEMGHLTKDKLRKFLRLRDKYERDSLWYGKTAQIAITLSLIPDKDWPEAADRMGIGTFDFRYNHAKDFLNSMK